MTHTSIRRHISREALISALINGASSVAFVFLIFAGIPEIPVWEVPGLVSDCVPQGFMFGLMAALVPSLLSRRALSTGRLQIGHSSQPSLRRILLTALLNGPMSAAVLTCSAAAVLALGGWQSVSFFSELALKAFAGAVLGALVTRITLLRLLGSS